MLATPLLMSPILYFFERDVWIRTQRAALVASRFSNASIIATVSYADPDTHGSALIWLTWILFRIGNAEPDPGVMN